MTSQELYTKIKGHRISTDSRDIKIGDVFFALKGENFDGNTYAEFAIEKGAFLAIIDNKDYVTKDCILVENCIQTLQDVALLHRRSLKCPIIGITGTNGKTTTKELCTAVLSEKYKTVSTKGNLNNHIGVPLTLLSIPSDAQMAIVEMGANHPGEIESLCKIVEPDYGIITNIGYAHLEGFGNYETIIETKTALYRSIINRGGEVFVNADDDLLIDKSSNIKRSTYGNASNADISGSIEQDIPYLVLSLHTNKGDLYIKTHLTGAYNFDNAMAAACLGHYFNVSDAEIKHALENYTPSNMRSQIIQTDKGNTVILDAYNANLSSMRVALNSFTKMKAEKKCCILGEMRELGNISEDAHREIAQKAIETGSSDIYFVGESFKSATQQSPAIHLFDNTDQLITELKAKQIKDSYILVKGSRGNKLEKIIDLL